MSLKFGNVFYNIEKGRKNLQFSYSYIIKKRENSGKIILKICNEIHEIWTSIIKKNESKTEAFTSDFPLDTQLATFWGSRNNASDWKSKKIKLIDREKMLEKIHHRNQLKIIKIDILIWEKLI